MLLQRNRYTAERLKFLYSDLLHAVDVSKENLGRRGEIEDDESSDEEVDRTNAANADGDLESDFILAALSRLRRSLVAIPLYWSHQHQQRRRRPHSSRVKRRARRASPEDLQAAFRFLAATRSPDKEGDHGDTAAWHDDEIVAALNAAKFIEKTVAGLIQQIGEVVLNSEKNTTMMVVTAVSSSSTCTGTAAPSIACDACFEFFCEKNMLHFLVEIAKENGNSIDLAQHEAHHGVVWGALVKAQVLQTVSLLVAAGSRKQHLLYYILSQNSINELLSCMLPLTQWTDPALSMMMPAFLDLLKNLGLLLAGSPDLFPFFANNDSFPLLHAALEIGTSAYAQADSFVHITCLSIIVNTMKIDTPQIQSWVSTAVPEMTRLCEHLSELLLNQYNKIADLSTGPIADCLRCNAIATQLVALQDHISVLNDVLSCGVPGLNVRLCEDLIRRVVVVVLKNLEPPKERNFLIVGVSDLDVVPHREALAQTSMIFLLRLFQYSDYIPFVRMLAVALFHPKSASIFTNNHEQKSNGSPNGKVTNGEYNFVPALDAIAQGKLLKNAAIVANPFRRAFLRTLRGDFGDWRFPAAAIVLETVLSSGYFDLETLKILDIIPSFELPKKCAKNGDKEEKTGEENDAGTSLLYYEQTDFEAALATFLESRSSALLTSVLRTCIECAGSLSLALYYKCVMCLIKYDNNRGSSKPPVLIPDDSNRTPLHIAMLNVKTTFCERALESQSRLGVSDIFLELVETAVVDRYKKVATTAGGSISPSQSTFACHLSQIGCAPLASSPDLLVRKTRCVKFTDVGEARFQVEMAIHFRALCSVVQRFSETIGEQTANESTENPGHSGSTDNAASMALDLVDVADEFAITFGGLSDRPDINSDLDLKGKMTFPCTLSIGAPPEPSILNLAEDAILRHSGELVLVVDPTDLFLVKPNPKSGVDQGTVVCRVALQSVIAAATDSDKLHIAVRHPDVGRLIKNGNMVLQFDSPSNCLVVRQYLDRCRNAMRRELNEQFRVFMAPSTEKSENEDQPTETADPRPTNPRGSEAIVQEENVTLDDETDGAPC